MKLNEIRIFMNQEKSQSLPSSDRQSMARQRMPEALHKMYSGDVTSDDVLNWMRMAFRIDMCLPKLGPYGYARIKIQTHLDEHHGYSRDGDARLIIVTASDVVLWQTVMSWFRLLNNEDAQLLKMKCLGLRQKSISKRFSINESKVSRHIKSSLNLIAIHVNTCSPDQIEVSPTTQRTPS
jgi:hypothetical protein